MNGLLALFTTISIQYQLPPGLLSALCYVESAHNTKKIHRNDGKSHSYGICQIKLETAREVGFRGTARQLMQPEHNIRFAALYLKQQIKRYNGDIRSGVIAYNRGHAGDLTTSKYQRKVYRVWQH